MPVALIYQNNSWLPNQEFAIRESYAGIHYLEIAKSRIMIYNMGIKEKGSGTAIPNPFLNKRQIAMTFVLVIQTIIT